MRRGLGGEPIVAKVIKEKSKPIFISGLADTVPPGRTVMPGVLRRTAIAEPPN
jgi:hypothetical protein